MAIWTKDNIPDLTGKVIIITGANSGLGYESTLALAEKGGTVVMACRNMERGQEAMEKIIAAVPSAKLDLMELDLASLNSIRSFAKTFQSKYNGLDVLMNNAGIMGVPRSLTEDGFEMQFGVNHLGHFALTGLLWDSLRDNGYGRVVNVSSRLHDTKLVWEDLMGERTYKPWEAYKQSKLANLLFTSELHRRGEEMGSKVKAISAHPGVATTNLLGHLNGIQGFFMSMAGRILNQSAATGALSQLYASVEPSAKPGAYYGPEKGFRGYPVEVRAADAAYETADAKRLWEVSEELTGVKFTNSQAKQ